MLELILNPAFYIPLLSTAGASLTIIVLQSIHGIDKERKQKLFATSYMTSIAVRLLQSSLVIKNNTITPHIKAAKKILTGDKDLLETMFLSDEFDILSEQYINYSGVPENHKILIGYDNIDLLQTFETMVYLSSITSSNNDFNNFVKDNLKNSILFFGKTEDERNEILNIYWDYLSKIEHREDRLIAFILYIALPLIDSYTKQRQFMLYKKQNFHNHFKQVSLICEKYKNILPNKDFFHKSVSGGIQNAV